MTDFVQLNEALEARVARLKKEGVPPVERSALTAEDRTVALRARSVAFQRGSQGPGKRMTYGSGKPEER